MLSQISFSHHTQFFLHCCCYALYVLKFLPIIYKYRLHSTYVHTSAYKHQLLFQFTFCYYYCWSHTIDRLFQRWPLCYYFYCSNSFVDIFKTILLVLFCYFFAFCTLIFRSIKLMERTSLDKYLYKFIYLCIYRYTDIYRCFYVLKYLVQLCLFFD